MRELTFNEKRKERERKRYWEGIAWYYRWIGNRDNLPIKCPKCGKVLFVDGRAAEASTK